MQGSVPSIYAVEDASVRLSSWFFFQKGETWRMRVVNGALCVAGARSGLINTVMMRSIKRQFG